MRESSTRASRRASGRGRPLVGAAGAGVLPLAMGGLARRGVLAIDHRSLALAMAGVLLFAAAVTWRWRAALLVTRAARRMAAVPFLALLSALVSLGLGAWLSLAPHASAVMALGAIAMVFATSAVVLDPRLFAVAAMMLVAATTGALMPTHFLGVVAIAGLCASGAVALRFLAVARRGPRPQARGKDDEGAVRAPELEPGTKANAQ